MPCSHTLLLLTARIDALAASAQGRIVGKAIADGQLLDAHFTHSFYKHILGVPVTYTDMEAIDPTYYKNLVQILQIPLEDLGLDLTFSAETNEFGRTKTVDLVPGGRNIAVDDSNKLAYVQRITHHRMTNAIRQQIEVRGRLLSVRALLACLLALLFCCSAACVRSIDQCSLATELRCTQAADVTVFIDTSGSLCRLRMYLCLRRLNLACMLIAVGTVLLRCAIY